MSEIQFSEIKVGDLIQVVFDDLDAACSLTGLVTNVGKSGVKIGRRGYWRSDGGVIFRLSQQARTEVPWCKICDGGSYAGDYSHTVTNKASCDALSPCAHYACTREPGHPAPHAALRHNESVAVF